MGLFSGNHKRRKARQAAIDAEEAAFKKAGYTAKEIPVARATPSQLGQPMSFGGSRSRLDPKNIEGYQDISDADLKKNRASIRGSGLYATGGSNAKYQASLYQPTYAKPTFNTPQNSRSGAQSLFPRSPFSGGSNIMPWGGPRENPNLPKSKYPGYTTIRVWEPPEKPPAQIKQEKKEDDKKKKILQRNRLGRRETVLTRGMSSDDEGRVRRQTLGAAS